MLLAASFTLFTTGAAAATFQRCYTLAPGGLKYDASMANSNLYLRMLLGSACLAGVARARATSECRLATMMAMLHWESLCADKVDNSGRAAAQEREALWPSGGSLARDLTPVGLVARVLDITLRRAATGSSTVMGEEGGAEDGHGTECDERQ